MKDAPKPLWAYAVITVISMLVLVPLEISAYAVAVVLGLAIAVVLTMLILAGSRIAWSLVTLFSLLSLVALPFEPQPWWSIVLLLATLACLLAPASLRFIWRRSRHARESPKPASVSWDNSDSERSSGWYIDPSNPRRMRYWNEEVAEWQGTTRTPRKIRRARPGLEG